MNKHSETMAKSVLNFQESWFFPESSTSTLLIWIMQEIDNFQEARIQTMEYTEFGIPFLLQTFHHDKKHILE